MKNNEMGKAAQAAMEALKKINEVDGFDPTPLAVEYTDLTSGESRLRLPVMALIGWFRLKYPEGRISNSVRIENNCFVCTARVYHHYADPVDQFLGEATVSRQYQADKPTVSPREWAQTAAIGIALRNAGFGLQFGAAGDAFDTPAADEIGAVIWSHDPPASSQENAEAEPITASAETPLEHAMKMPCPISKYSGKTLGDILGIDPKALVWVANKFTGDDEISNAAKLICEQAVEQTV